LGLTLVLAEAFGFKPDLKLDFIDISLFALIRFKTEFWSKTKI